MPHNQFDHNEFQSAEYCHGFPYMGHINQSDLHTYANTVLSSREATSNDSKFLMDFYQKGING